MGRMLNEDASLRSKALSDRLTSLKQTLAQQMIEQSVSPNDLPEAADDPDRAIRDEQAAALGSVAAHLGPEIERRFPSWIEHGLPSSSGRLPGPAFSAAPPPPLLASPSPPRSSTEASRWLLEEPSPAARLEARMSGWAVQGPSTTLLERKLAFAEGPALDYAELRSPPSPSRRAGPASLGVAIDESAAAVQDQTSVTPMEAKGTSEESPLPGSALASGNSMRLLKRILAADASRREALWGLHLAEKEHRRVRKAWSACERLHAATLSRLRALEERLQVLAQEDGNRQCIPWGNSSEGFDLPLAARSSSSSPWLEDPRRRLQQLRADLEEERRLHRDERATAQAKHAKLFKERADAQMLLTSLRAAGPPQKKFVLGSGGLSTAALAVGLLMEDAAPEVAGRSFEDRRASLEKGGAVAAFASPMRTVGLAGMAFRGAVANRSASSGRRD